MSIIENTCNCRKNYVGLPREQITSKSIWFRIHVSFSIPSPSINSNLPLFSCSIIFLRDDMKNGSNEVDRGSYTLPQNLLFYPPNFYRFDRFASKSSLGSSTRGKVYNSFHIPPISTRSSINNSILSPFRSRWNSLIEAKHRTIWPNFRDAS